MAVVRYDNVPVWIGTGVQAVSDFGNIPKSNYVLAQNISIQNQTQLSTNRVLNNNQRTQFDNYGITANQNINLSITFIAETSGSGLVNCLNHLTGNIGGYVVVGNDYYDKCYLNNLSVNILPFQPVIVNVDFSCYNPEQVNEFVVVYGNYTWTQAKDDAVVRGGRLAILDSKQKNDRVPTHDGAMWIGLNDRKTDGIWRWVDGTRVKKDDLNWGRNEPDNGRNEDYAVRLPNGKWADTTNDQSLIPATNTRKAKGYILEYNKVNQRDTSLSKPTNISDYKQKIIYGHSVLVDDAEDSLSDNIKDSISYSVSCSRTPVYTIGSILPQKFFLDSLEKEISIKSTNINRFIDQDGYDSSILIDLKDETGRKITSISLERVRLNSQNLTIQEGDTLTAEIKAKEVVL
jgi:hypothetical protein